MKKVPEFYFYIPVAMFMLVSRIMSMTPHAPNAWKWAFFVGAFEAIFVTAWGIFVKQLLDRLALGINLFLVIGALAFLLNISPLLNLYGQYQGGVFFGSILLIGFVTTIATSAGFIGIEKGSKSAIGVASIKLLLFTAVVFVFSVLTKQYGIIISIALPFIALRFMRDFLITQMQ